MISPTLTGAHQTQIEPELGAQGSAFFSGLSMPANTPIDYL